MCDATRSHVVYTCDMTPRASLSVSLCDMNLCLTFEYATWLMCGICAMTHVWCDAFVPLMWLVRAIWICDAGDMWLSRMLIHVCDMADVWLMCHDACVMWRIHTCDMTRVGYLDMQRRRHVVNANADSCMWHGWSLTYATWLLRDDSHVMTDVWCDAFVTCDMTRVWYLNMWCSRVVISATADSCKCKRRFMSVQTLIQACDMADVWRMRQDSCVMWRIHHMWHDSCAFRMWHDSCVTCEHVMHATCEARRRFALLRVYRALLRVYRALVSVYWALSSVQWAFLRVYRAVFMCDMTRVWQLDMWCRRRVMLGADFRSLYVWDDSCVVYVT